MCHKYTLTPEDLDKIIRYVNDEAEGIPSFDTIGNFQALYFSLQRKLASDFQEIQKKCFRMERRLERIDRHEERKIQEGVFAESGIDSLEVADVLLYHLQQLQTWKFTKNKFMSILFHIYASWLGSKRERLFTEQPVATEWGPHFWRVSKRLNLTQQIPYDAVKALQEKRPDIAAYIRNAAHKYYDVKEDELSKVHKNCAPYKNASPQNNGGKCNKVINDSDIYLWQNPK